MESLPQRPPPARSLGESVRAWLLWFGVARLVVTSLAVVGVGAGAYWLVRAPATPIENTLPIAATSTTTATTTSMSPASASSVPSTGGTNEPIGTVASAPAGIEVYVAGAVAVPGVYELGAGARVHDAVDAAGGLGVDADVDALNLAAAVADGDRVYVPRIGQAVPTVVLPSGGSAANSSNSPGESEVASEPIDLNEATVDELDALPGVGPATAAAIVAHREQNGPFASIDDLLAVRGIGPAKLDAIRALVTV